MQNKINATITAASYVVDEKLSITTNNFTKLVASTYMLMTNLNNRISKNEFSAIVNSGKILFPEFSDSGKVLPLGVNGSPMGAQFSKVNSPSFLTSDAVPMHKLAHQVLALPCDLPEKTGRRTAAAKVIDVSAYNFSALAPTPDISEDDVND